MSAELGLPPLEPALYSDLEAEAASIFDRMDPYDQLLNAKTYIQDSVARAAAGRGDNVFSNSNRRTWERYLGVIEELMNRSLKGEDVSSKMGPQTSTLVHSCGVRQKYIDLAYERGINVSS